MPETLRLLMEKLPTPIGELVLLCDDAGRLRVVEWDNGHLERQLARCYGRDGFALTQTDNPFGHRSSLAAYFNGDIHAIDSLPAAPEGTPFQQSVWRALRLIPAAQTISYGQLAARLGKPSASRAVGLANGANPVAVVIPCHRVIGANGSLTGYGGGLERKRWLINHERNHQSTRFPLARE